MIKICFSARPGYHKFSTRLFIELKKLGSQIIPVFITNDKFESSYVSEQVPDSIVYDVASYMESIWDKLDQLTLSDIEKEYDCAPIWKYIYTDRFLIHRDYSYCVKTTAGLFKFFEYVFTKEKIVFYYDETIATLQSYVAYLVGKKHKVQYVSQMVARGKDATHHYFLVDPFQLNAYFGKSEEIYKNYSSEAEIFLSEFEQKNPKPSNMIFSGKLPKLRLKFFVLPLYWLYHRFNPKLNNKYSYMYYKGYSRILNSLIFYVRYQVSKKNYKNPDLTKKYVYYPLHYQPEASTIVCAQKYEKQLFYIDSWAKSLPADTMLYVKEHYAVLGHRELSFYRELRKYPNVVLIDPLVDTFSLIKNSVAVTTLTGTAGWEAMLLRKPVFLGGRIFYEDAPGVIRVDDIYGNYLSLLNSWKQPSREDVIEYLAHYLSTLRKGWVYAASSSVYEGDNMHNVAISLIEYLKDQGCTI